MIIVKISGGLGNQMFQYAVGRAIAIERNDILKLDLSFYSKQNLRTYKLDRFKIKPIIACEDEINSLKGNENIFWKIKRKLKLSNNRPKSYICDPLLSKSAQNSHSLYNINIIKENNNENIYLDGYWQSSKYFSNIKKTIKSEFKLKNQLSNNTKLNLLKILKSNNSTSIHIRRGDYVDNTKFKNSGLSISPMSYYNQAIKHIELNIEKPFFFIFSDDIEWCKENFSFLKNKSFIENCDSDVEELFLMSSCKHNIIANSTFSWWAAWLNKNKDNVTIAPKIWFKTNKTLNPALDDWIKL